jgi:inorganic pyrophosphatase
VEFAVIVEIPKGSRNKYEMDHSTGAIWLDRMLFTATTYPTDYGFVPDTLAGDGDPLDVLVLLEEPTFPGCHIRVRAIGVLGMEDEKGEDLKVLCVPATDPRWSAVTDIDDVPSHLLDEIQHFFEVYKALEPTKHVQSHGWAAAAEAERAIDDARRAYAALERGAAEPASET